MCKGYYFADAHFEGVFGHFNLQLAFLGHLYASGVDGITMAETQGPHIVDYEFVNA